MAKRKQVAIPAEAHEKLEKICEIDHRSFGDEVTWLIDRRVAELAREAAPVIKEAPQEKVEEPEPEPELTIEEQVEETESIGEAYNL